MEAAEDLFFHKAHKETCVGGPHLCLNGDTPGPNRSGILRMSAKAKELRVSNMVGGWISQLTVCKEALGRPSRHVALFQA